MLGKLIIASAAGYFSAGCAWIAGFGFLGGLAVLSLVGASVFLTLAVLAWRAPQEPELQPA